MIVTTSAGVLPELVLLLDEPLVFEKNFLQGAVVAAFGRVLPTDDPDAVEFVTGDFPIFFVGIKGNLIQVKSMPFPYNAQASLPFVQGEPEELLTSIEDLGFRKKTSKHKGWISVTLMKQDETKPTPPFKLVSKMLSSFGFEEISAILCPSHGKILPWDFDMQEKLSRGKGLRLFHLDES